MSGEEKSSAGPLARITSLFGSGSIGLSANQIFLWIQSGGAYALFAAAQFVSFLLIARAIGVVDYAVLVGIGATVSMCVELVGLGCGDLMVRSMARDRHVYQALLARSLSVIAFTLPFIACFASIFVILVYDLDIAWWIIACLVTSELLSIRSLVFAEAVAVGHERVAIANLYRMIAALGRFLVALTAIVLFSVDSIEGWWLWQFCLGLTLPVIFFTLVTIQFGRPEARFDLSGLFEGNYYSLVQIMRGFQFNIDRVFVGQLGDPIILGSYGVAARVFQLGLFPVQAAMRITYPHYFNKGQQGIVGSRGYARKLVLPIFGVGVLTSAGLFLAAPLLPMLLGPDYELVGDYLPMLSPLVAAIALQYVFGDALTGADLQKVRLVLLACGLVLIYLSVWIASAFIGIFGIMLAVVLSNFVLALMFVGAAEYLAKRALKAEGPAVSASDAERDRVGASGPAE